MKQYLSIASIHRFIRSLTFILGLAATSLAGAGESTFTWQGRLTDNGRAAEGRYDLRFSLFDGEYEMDPLGTNQFAAVVVTSGLYTAQLDFGLDVFDGGPRWLEIAVRTNGATAFTKLSPRMELTSTPYALHATSAARLSGSISASQLSTNVARLDVDASFQGKVSATNFTGNGAGLTNIPATGVRGAVSALNVRDFGAVGDGVADDTDAIQAAIDATTNSLLAGDVFFPAGRYRITAPLRVLPNDTHWNLMPQWGPVRLFGNGSASSVILSSVSDGPAIDARTDGPDHYGLIGFTMDRLGLIGPLTDSWELSDGSEGLALGWANEGSFQYCANEIKLKDCEFSGFTKAIGSTNVWGFTADNCTFHSNRLHALAFNCTHSVNLRNLSIYGVAVPGRLTDIAIGFFAPREAPGWWGFGDTAEMHQTQIQWSRVAVYNDELHLLDSGGNYQFVDLGHQIRSNWRTNGNGFDMWRPWATLQGVTYCDSDVPWVTNSPAMVEIDSYVAPRVTFLPMIGDVCKNHRAKVNIIGASVIGSANNGYIAYGTTNFDVPTLLGGAVDWISLHNGSNFVTLHRWGGSSNTLRGPLTLVGGAFVGDGSGLTNLSPNVIAAAVIQTNGGLLTNGGAFFGDASGLTNFNQQALAASGAVTNGGTFVGDGSGLTNLALNAFAKVGILTNGGVYFGNASGLTNFSAPALAASGAVTNGGKFAGDGHGLTNLAAVAQVINVRDFGALGDGVADDSAAVQAAIYASTNFGACADVFFPPGRYRITTTLDVPPNDYGSAQHAAVGPLRLLGSGSAASVLAFSVLNRVGIDFRSEDLNVHGFEIHRLGIEGPLVDSWNPANRCVGIAGGWQPNPAHTYQGTHFLMQSCNVSGWSTAVGLSNVWNATFDNCDFLSNRLHGLAFSCTHSVTIRNSHISGQPFEGMLTGTGIGFFAPTQTNTWNFGDTAQLENSRVDWCTNAIWNNELALLEQGGNHQFCGKFIISRSGTRTIDGGLWRPYNIILNTTFCDSSLPWVTNGPACVEMDSYSAERFTWVQAIGDVCTLDRAFFNVLGTTNGGYVYTNFFPPTLLGGAIPRTGVFNGTNEVTIYPLKSFQPTFNGPVTITNANQYLPALAILTGGQGSSRAAALAIGGDVNANSMSANTEHIGAWHGYTYSNGVWTVPDLEVVSYRAAQATNYIGLGGTPGLLSTPGKGAQEIHLYTAPRPKTTPNLAGGVNAKGGVTFGARWNSAVTNGEVSAQSGFSSYRTNSWTTNSLAANGFGFWNSNGTIYCTVNIGGVLTNKLIVR